MPRDHAPCSDRRSCSRSCARCRTLGRPRSSPRHQAAAKRTEDARPSPNTPSRASAPPVPKMTKGVTHVSGTTCHLCLRPLKSSLKAASRVVVMFKALYGLVGSGDCFLDKHARHSVAIDDHSRDDGDYVSGIPAFLMPSISTSIRRGSLKRWPCRIRERLTPGERACSDATW